MHTTLNTILTLGEGDSRIVWMQAMVMQVERRAHRGLSDPIAKALRVSASTYQTRQGGAGWLRSGRTPGSRVDGLPVKGQQPARRGHRSLASPWPSLAPVESMEKERDDVF